MLNHPASTSALAARSGARVVLSYRVLQVARHPMAGDFNPWTYDGMDPGLTPESVEYVNRRIDALLALIRKRNTSTESMRAAAAAHIALLEKARAYYLDQR